MKEFEPILTEIESLFSDPHRFSEMAASIDVNMVESIQFDFNQYPLGVYWIGIGKDQVKSIEEAFATLFILDLHIENCWIYDERFRMNEEQFVIKEMPMEEWITILRDHWIVDYFHLKHRKLNISIMDIDNFQHRLLHWMPENSKKHDADSLKEILLTTRWVCSLFPEAFYDKYFGATNDYYFFAESGVYD